MLKSQRSMSSLRYRLLGLAAIAAWFLCPLPQPSAIKTVNVERMGTPSSTVVDDGFTCTRGSDEILLRWTPKLTSGRVQLGVLDPNGKALAGPFDLTGEQGDSVTFVTDEGFRRGQAFHLRCTESEVLGHYRPSGTSVLPLDGQLPHVTGNPSAHLAPWQIAMTAMAGPLLPTLIGYALLVFWVSPSGRRWRTRRPGIDLGGSLLIVILVFPQVVSPVLVLFPHAMPDRDTSLFMENVGQPLWGVRIAIVAVALINLAIVVWVLRCLVLRIRAARRALQGAQRTGAGHYGGETDPTSTA